MFYVSPSALRRIVNDINEKLTFWKNLKLIRVLSVSISIYLSKLFSYFIFYILQISNSIIRYFFYNKIIVWLGQQNVWLPSRQQKVFAIPTKSWCGNKNFVDQTKLVLLIQKNLCLNNKNLVGTTKYFYWLDSN